MFYTTQQIDLNFSRPTHVKIYSVLGDSSTRQIRANLYDGSSEVILADAQGLQQFNNCFILYQRPDGSRGMYNADAGYTDIMTRPDPSRNTIFFVLAPEMVAEEGTVKVWLFFTSASETGNPEHGIRTFPFEIDVAGCTYYNPEDPDFDPLEEEAGT